jgi:DNA-directed RNA polymerase subunit RPC12/RpoP
MDEKAPPCPTCGATLTSFPKQKRRCPNCHNPIFVKTHPESRAVTLATEAEAAGLAIEWKPIYEKLGSFRWLERFGLPISDYEAERGEILLEAGFSATEQEILLRFLTTRFEAEQDIPTRKTVALCLAEALDYANLDFRPYLGFAIRQNLIEIADSGFKKVLVFSAGDACRACKRLDARTFTVASRLTAAYFPGLDCTATLRGSVRGWCRCGVEPVD